MIPFLLALFVAAAPQAQEVPVPPPCIGPTFVSWEACAAAAPEGTPAYSLAMINLGTEAYMRGDKANALAYYDKAEMPGKSLTSDVLLHAFRADARRYGGRTTEAAADAQIAWTYVEGGRPTGVAAGDVRPLDDDLRSLILGLILPILKDAGSADFRRARDMYVALPAESWMALSQRAGTLSSLGEHEAAVAASRAALDLQPNDPMSKNNHCYVLVEAGRAPEGLAYCESAATAAPKEPAVLHSYATALAAVGRCDAAAVQLAEASRLDPAAVLYREPLACTPVT